ncbi:hypothetical protein Tco_0935988, partial [Tanacetum coccineum]
NEALYYGSNEVDFEQRMEELMYYDTDDGASISEKKMDVPTWFSDEYVDQDIDVEWQDDPYHNVNKPKDPQEISDMFVELDQALDELDQLIEAQDLSDLFAIYDQLINDEADVVPLKVVTEEMGVEEAFNEGVLSVDDGDVIPPKVYDVMVAQEMLEDQTRATKRRRVMADKEDEDDPQ